MRARVQVFVCGEPARGDDAAGFAAVALLSAEVRARAEIREVGQLDVLLLLDLPAEEACVVVDAVAGIPAGEVWVTSLPALVGRARALADTGRAPEPRSSHELPLEQVLALAATMREAPPAGTFVGIGGSCWDVGTPLTEAVAAGVPAFAASIAAAIEDLAEGRAAGRAPRARPVRARPAGATIPGRARRSWQRRARPAR